MKPYNFLFVNLDSDISAANKCEQLSKLIENNFTERKACVQTITSFPPWPVNQSPDIILLRPDADSKIVNILQHLRKHCSTAQIFGILCPERYSSSEISTFLYSGMDDYLFCPVSERDLVPRMHKFFRYKGEESVADNNILPSKSLIGESQCVQEVIKKISLLARSDMAVLIQGETGTGKELITREIHYNSPRHGKPFIPVGCGALPDQLFENEFFGHIKGAFTDASSEEKGIIAEAEKGTIFLDEVDTLSPATQIKLLRFLQNKEYRPLGSSKNLIADVRIIAATNANLKEKVEAKCFREDLYYRLNVLNLSIPPLRKRSEDIPLLANHFLRLHKNQPHKQPLRLSSSALEKLIAYHWPGNVRELEGIIQQAIILSPNSVLQPNDIEFSSTHNSVPSYSNLTIQGAKKQAISLFERAFLIKLMTKESGNVTQAAVIAGKDRRSFQRLLRKYNLNRENFQEVTN